MGLRCSSDGTVQNCHILVSTMVLGFLRAKIESDAAFLVDYVLVLLLCIPRKFRFVLLGVLSARYSIHGIEEDCSIFWRSYSIEGRASSPDIHLDTAKT